MGGYMQPQGHLQVMMNYIDFGLNEQEALMHRAGSGWAAKRLKLSRALALL